MANVHRITWSVAHSSLAFLSLGTQIEFWQAKAPAERTGDRNDDVAGDKDQPRLVRRVYTVFNAKQIDGIPTYAPRQHSAFETAQAGERILANSGATIVHDQAEQADQAFYRLVRIAFTCRRGMCSTTRRATTGQPFTNSPTGPATKTDRLSYLCSRLWTDIGAATRGSGRYGNPTRPN